MIASLLLSAVLAHGAHTMPPPTVHELPRAEQATGRTVFCMSLKTSRRLGKLWNEPIETEADYWVPSAHVILILNSECAILSHPHKDRWQGVGGGASEPSTLASAIFLLGHEAAHARQQDLGVPFSEHQANCWSKAGFQTLKQRLHIRMRVTFAMTGIRLHCR